MSTSNPDLPAENVTVDRTVLFGVCDDMADAALALEAGNDLGQEERDRCVAALRAGISQLWMEANLHQLHLAATPPAGP
ncbi:MAG: hypothetical protein WKF86_09505 [Acidimicrobiales bacterium]